MGPVGKVLHRSTYTLRDLGVPILVIARPPRRGIPDDLLQHRLQIRRLRGPQPDKPWLIICSRTEALSQLLEQ
jgi:hypothetical protein